MGGYRVDGTYNGEPAMLRLTPKGVSGGPDELVRVMARAMGRETWVTPHPQPQEPYLMDHRNPDHLLGFLRNVPGMRITGIDALERPMGTVV